MPKPTPDLVRRVIESIKTAADADYFFDHLTSPEWIKPLREAGMFSKPPGPIPQGDLVQLPAWSASRYLVRMAPVDPEAVAETIRAIDHTDNGRVTLDLVDAVIAMTDDVAVTMADLASQWVQSPFLLDVPTRVGELIVKLAGAGAIEEALLLLTKVLRLEISSDNRDLGGHGVRSPLRDWNYQHLLETALPGLLEADGLATLRALCDLLGSVTSVHGAPGRQSDDYSWLWRPAIEPHQQNHDRGPLDALISSVRDASEHVLNAEPTRLDTVLGVLRERASILTERLELHLLRLFAAAGSDELARALTTRGQMGRPAIHHEYWHLLHDRFADLDLASREMILQALAEGPHVDPDLPEEEQDVRRAAWQRRYLAAVEEHIPLEWAQRFAGLSDVVDPSPHPDFLTYMTVGRTGPTSPLTVDDLAARSIDEIIEYLRIWQPEDSLMSASIEGLARELTDAVANDPTRFANEATKFIDLDPTYVRGLLAGFRTAVSNDASFDWANVIELALQAVRKPRSLEERGARSNDDGDPDWTWARTEVARLLSEGLQDGPAEIPQRLRDVVWETLAVLVEDPNPDPEYEARYGGSNMDPTTLSLNTVRGKGFGALMDYMLWVRRYQERRDDGEALASGFQAMPEVAKVLERHLDPTVDPSASIRSVYGRTLPWLILVDERWTTEHLSELFPDNPDLASLRDAAWDAYIVHCRVYDTAFEVLIEEYRKAISRLASRSSRSGGRNDAAVHLAEHLMMLFWRDKVDLGQEGLVRAFFQNADDDVRSAALAFLGRGLEAVTGSSDKLATSLSGDLVSRMRQLWDWRLDSARAADATSAHARELRQFGWWYGSGVFDERWALPNLAEAIRLGGSPEGEHKVLQQLRVSVYEYPTAVVQVLGALLRADKERWIAHAYREDVVAILETALASDLAEAASGASDVAHELGAMGFPDFRSLVE